MKKLIVITSAALLLTGCCATKFAFKKPDGSMVSITNYRLFWTTDSYNVSLSTNTATMSANKSTVDSDSIAAVASGVVHGMEAAKP